MSILRVLIADDHETLREGVKALVEHEPGCEVCAMVTNGLEAVRSAKALKPDVVILDMTMPELSGLEATRQIKRALPETEILFFSADCAEEVVIRAFDAGAKSYIRKSDAVVHLVNAIRSLRNHKPYFTPEVSDILFAKFIQVNPKDGSKGKLTAREQRILRLLAEGQSNKDAAEDMGISVRTVETHRASVMRKLRLDSVAALVRYAVRNGVVEA